LSQRRFVPEKGTEIICRLDERRRASILGQVFWRTAISGKETPGTVRTIGSPPGVETRADVESFTDSRTTGFILGNLPVAGNKADLPGTEPLTGLRTTGFTVGNPPVAWNKADLPGTETFTGSRTTGFTVGNPPVAGNKADLPGTETGET